MWRPVFSRRILVLAVAASAGAGIGLGSLSACSSGASQSAGTVPAAATQAAPATTAASATAPSPVTAATPGGTAPASPLTADQASAIAVQVSPGTVTKVEQDDEGTGPVFDVEVQHADGTETDVQVDANSGQVISTKTDGPDDQSGDGH